MTKLYQIYNEDCITGSSKINDNSIDLIICDPPFGINETSFHKHYNRSETTVINGYQEAPKDYYKFSLSWLSECKRILKNNGSMYIISGWSNLIDILNAIKELELYTINHLIWKFNFGIYTKNKFVTSHYHIIYIKKNKDSQHTFNTYCRFGNQEKENGKSLNYQDLEDVFVINKEYHKGTIKNKNKLPNALIEKLILYSSNENDIVCDFFLGNFTTAIVSKKLGRNFIGFEINKESYKHFIEIYNNITYGEDLKNLKIVSNKVFKNQGKPISINEKKEIIKEFNDMSNINKNKKDIIKELSEKFSRGEFSINNIIKKQ